MTLKQMWKQAWERNIQVGNATLRTKILRVFGIGLAKILLYTPITANHVSIMGGLAILAASILFAFGKFWLSLLALLMLYVGEVFDHADGVVARSKGSVTKMQADFLCRIYHPGMFAFIFAGIGMGVYFNEMDVLFIILGFLAALFQQTTVYILELKNSVMLNYAKDKIHSFEGIRNSFINSSIKKKLLKVFAFPIEWLYAITLVFLLLNKLDWLIIFYTFYLFIRLLIFLTMIYKKLKTMENMKNNVT